MSIIITGTGTDAGKTVLSALIMGKYGVDKQMLYWKPVQTGTEHDADVVKQLTGLGEDRILPSAYTFPVPASPHFAARKAGGVVEMGHLLEVASSRKNANLLVEGAGGLYVPLNDKELMIDFFVRLDFPVVLVVSSLLGTINNSLLSLNAMKDAGLRITGFFMYGPENDLKADNISTIERFSGVHCLGHGNLEKGDFSREGFLKYCHTKFDPEQKLGVLL